MANVLDTLMERGYIKQFTHEAETRELLEKEKVTFYIGFDPTADSLHVGHFIAMMFMAHMQKAGHRPIALIGGGTATIGDPSGKTDMRKMMTNETIAHNVACIKKQMEKFIDFSDDKAILVNNADWLLNQNYVEFLREVGVHFSVNRMLSAECFKQRLERGLSFLEFNYMLMQGYDFYVLNKKYNCKMELGGDDQWSNMIAGVELVRKKSQESAYAMTCTLLTNSEGQKMGKTVNGALWLDPEKTSAFRIDKATFGGEPARAVRQEDNTDQQQYRRNDDNPEHPAPCAAVAESGVREIGAKDPDGDHQLVHGNHTAANFFWGDFRQIQRSRI